MHHSEVIIGYLGRALSFELSAVQQYLSLSSLLKMRGFEEAGKHFHDEAQEELDHARRIIARMIALGFAPNASQLRPTRLEGSLVELLQHAKTLELDIVELYSKATDYCKKANDHDNWLFFDTILKEEQQHASSIADWQQKLLSSQQ